MPHRCKVVLAIEHQAPAESGVVRCEGKDHLLLDDGQLGLGVRVRDGARVPERRPVALASSPRDANLAQECIALDADQARRHGVVALLCLPAGDLLLGVLESQMVEPRVLALVLLRLGHRRVLDGERARFAADADEFALAQEEPARLAHLEGVAHQNLADLGVAELRDPVQRLDMVVVDVGCLVVEVQFDAGQATAGSVGQEREQPAAATQLIDRLVTVGYHDCAGRGRGRGRLVGDPLERDARRGRRVVVGEIDWSRVRHGSVRTCAGERGSRAGESSTATSRTTRVRSECVWTSGI